MSRQRTQDTTPEMALRSELHSRGLRFRVHQRPVSALRREADVVFRRARVAVFVDGCFWHGCPDHGTLPKRNDSFWRDKILGNQIRDVETDNKLEEEGWLVVRVWEHEPPARAADRVAAALESRQTVDPR
jgi:DNA mismatch endonuclease, patch repair protein